MRINDVNITKVLRVWRGCGGVREGPQSVLNRSVICLFVKMRSAFVQCVKNDGGDAWFSEFDRNRILRYNYTVDYGEEA